MVAAFQFLWKKKNLHSLKIISWMILYVKILSWMYTKTSSGKICCSWLLLSDTYKKRKPAPGKYLSRKSQKTTKGFSVNYFLYQQLVLDIDINGNFLLAVLFLKYSLQSRFPKFTTNNTTLPLPKSNVLHSFCIPNFTFSVHNCSDLGWPRVHSW